MAARKSKSKQTSKSYKAGRVRQTRGRLYAERSGDALSETRSFTINPHLWERVEKAAANQRKSKSAMMTEILELPAVDRFLRSQMGEIEVDGTGGQTETAEKAEQNGV